MDCCEFEKCTEQFNCPVRRQPAYPATVPPELPIWPNPVPRESYFDRVLRIAAALAGYADLLFALMSVAAVIAYWMAL